jgi:hypothetical protein
MDSTTKFIEKHLAEITPSRLYDFKRTSFASMASFGAVNIGVTGMGDYAVKSRTETFYFDNAQSAIQKYTELVNHQA